MKIRYAISRTSNDRFPIFFQDTCERTCSDQHGNSEGLLELMSRLDAAGYDLVDEPPPLKDPG